MYDYFNGKLAEKNGHYAVVEVGGIGYKLHIPISLFAKLPQIGEHVLIYASWVVRETSQALYGFVSKEERELFELLLTVSGIGPKTALGLIGHFEPSAFQDAVRGGNVAALAKSPGIGKKTAEKLIVDLKSKLKMSTFSSIAYPSKTQDALNALLRLGYSQMSAEHAVQKA
ncbi:Holliday junction branch migration protein RuvA, partial [Chlamydiota bacterium]